MGYFTEVDPGRSFGPFLRLEQGLGFVPNLFRAQTLLPRAIDAETGIAEAVLLREAALTRVQKESILLVLSAAHENLYCAAAHAHLLTTLGVPRGQVERIAADHRGAGLPDRDIALLEFACRLSGRPLDVARRDFDVLRSAGFTDGQIFEAVLMTSLTEFLCTLSAGVGAAPDFDPPRLMPARRFWIGTGAASGAPPARAPDPEAPGPYLSVRDRLEESLPPFAFFRDRFGFVPNIFRVQTLRPDVLEAEARAVGAVLLSDDLLARVQKEYILLAISAANLNTYCVAVHCELLRGLGVPEETSDRIAVDHHHAPLKSADKALLDFALKLARRPREFTRVDIDALRGHGFSEVQALEAVVMAALTNFLNTLQIGLGTTPDFPPPRKFEDSVKPPAPARTPMDRDRAPGSPSREDEDGPLVARAREGDLGAFEDLVRRHHRRVYRTLMGITGHPEDAEDGTQSTFLKAFEHIGGFQGGARFSTWLTRIAINEGVQRLRRRRETESLDAVAGDDREEEEPFRPADLQAWTENPEQIYSRAEIRGLLEKEMMKLPAKYRLAVILRDMEHLSTEEAAAAMGLGAATFKTRLSRARFMLREALAPHFARREGGADD